MIRYPGWNDTGTHPHVVVLTQPIGRALNAEPSIRSLSSGRGWTLSFITLSFDGESRAATRQRGDGGHGYHWESRSLYKIACIVFLATGMRRLANCHDKCQPWPMTITATCCAVIISARDANLRDNMTAVSPLFDLLFTSIPLLSNGSNSGGCWVWS